MKIPQLAKQTAIYGIPSIVGRLLNFLLVPLYTYIFLPQEYGIVTELYAYTALLLVILTYGMETTFFRFMQKAQTDKVFSTSVWSLLATSLIFLSAVLLFRNNIASFFDYPNAQQFVVWFAFILFADVMMAIPFCLLRQENRAMRFAVLRTINIALNIGLNLFFILLLPALLQDFKPDVKYIFLSNLVASGITLLLLMPELRRTKPVFDKRLWRDMMIYTLPVMVWGIAGIIDSTFDKVLFRSLIPDKANAMHQLGIYGACAKLAVIMNLCVQAFRYAAEPYFFKKAQQKNAAETYARVMNYFVMACCIIFLGCSLFLDELMLLVGKDYREGADVVPVLLMANLFLGIFYNLSIWYKVTDKTSIGAVIAVIGSALSIGLNVVLIPVFGYHGAAWAALACYFAITAISYFTGQKYYPVNYPLGRIFFYLLLAVSLYVVKVLVDLEGFWGVLVSVGLFVGYLAVICAVHGVLKKGIGRKRS
ncbi:MAG: oligosaccharide flippase family protein [Bacteroidales bacterium]|jgi:O-antigen/teichoic acid export membrane protein|nr:oligosaccharide flippase family protein [Bacteroidales bacterium]